MFLGMLAQSAQMAEKLEFPTANLNSLPQFRTVEIPALPRRKSGENRVQRFIVEEIVVRTGYNRDWAKIANGSELFLEPLRDPRVTLPCLAGSVEVRATIRPGLAVHAKQDNRR